MRGDAAARPRARAAAGAARRARAVDRRRAALARVLDARRVVAALRGTRRAAASLVAALGASLLLALLRLVPKHEVAAPARLRAAARAASARRGRAREPPPLAASAVARRARRGARAPRPASALAPRSRPAASRSRPRASRLVVWRDGIPASFEPLLPLEPVGAHAPALATLAADVSLLTGVDPGQRRARRSSPAAAGSCSWVSSRSTPPGRPPEAAALGALVALAASPWPGFLSLWGEGEALLALVLPAARRGAPSRSRVALLGRGRSAAARGGCPRPAAPRGPRARARVGRRRSAAAARRAARPGGSRGAACLALILAAPGLLPLARALVGARGAGRRAPRAGRTSSCRSRPRCCSRPWLRSRSFRRLNAARPGRTSGACAGVSVARRAAPGRCACTAGSPPAS